MHTWTTDELERVGDAEELQIASFRSDGSLRPFVIIWVVRVDDGIYVRSAFGPGSHWYRHARASGTGRIRAGGVERDVTFAEPEPNAQDAIDAAYHAKYDSYGAVVVGTVVDEQAHELTFRLLPR